MSLVEPPASVEALRAAILDSAALRDALQRAAAEDAVFMPNVGNAGDGLIALGAYHLFRALGLHMPVVAGDEARRPGGTLVLGGGGGLLEGLYDEPAASVRTHLQSGGRLLLLPSTVLGFERLFETHAEQVILFARERTTYERLRAIPGLGDRVHLCHDLALAIDPGFLAEYRQAPGEGRLIALRADDESLANDVEGGPDIQFLFNGRLWHDEAFCGRVCRLYAAYIAGFDEVVTDRLHLAVLAAMLHRRVVLAPNSYHKNQSVHQFSLKNLPRMSFAEDVSAVLREGGTPSRGASQQRTGSGQSRARQFEWDAGREKAAFLQQELDRLRAELAELQKVRLEWWDPEIKRLTEVVARYEGELAARDETIKEYERARKEWFEPELRKAVERVAELEQTRLDWWEPELQRLNAEIERFAVEAQEAEALRGKVEKLELERSGLLTAQNDFLYPEINRLTDALAQRSEAQSRAEVLEAALRSAEQAEERGRAELQRATEAASRLSQRARRDLDDYSRQLASQRTEIASLLTERDEQRELIDTWFKPEWERLSADVAELRQVKTVLQSQVDDLKRQIADGVQHRELIETWFTPETTRLYEEAEESAQREAALAATKASLEARAVSLEATVDQLRRALEQAESRRRSTVFEARRALTEYADYVFNSRQTLEGWRATVEEQRELIEGWFRPETARLYRDLEALEQRRARADELAAHRAAENAQLRRQLQEQEQRAQALRLDAEQDVEAARRTAEQLRDALSAVERSRAFKLLRLYRGVYRAPGLSLARRAVKRLVSPTPAS